MLQPTAAQLARFEAVVGAEAFAHLCDRSWATAVGAGRRDAPGMGKAAEATLDALEDACWDHANDVPLSVADWLALYAAAPSYPVLARLTDGLRVLAEPERTLVWAGYRGALDDPDDRLAGPISYSLWVDLFESGHDLGGRTICDVAWDAVCDGMEQGSLRMNRVLTVSGPVPWALKASLLDRAVGDARCRVATLAALVGAAFDYFGQIDEDHARRLLARLPAGPGEHGREQLRERLG